MTKQIKPDVAKHVIFRFLPVLPPASGFLHVGTAAIAPPHFTVTIAQPMCCNTRLYVETRDRQIIVMDDYHERFSAFFVVTVLQQNIKKRITLALMHHHLSVFSHHLRKTLSAI